MISVYRVKTDGRELLCFGGGRDAFPGQTIRATRLQVAGYLADLEEVPLGDVAGVDLDLTAHEPPRMRRVIMTRPGTSRQFGGTSYGFGETANIPERWARALVVEGVARYVEEASSAAAPIATPGRQQSTPPGAVRR